MGRYLFFFFWLICLSCPTGVQAQSNLKLNGTVLNAKTRTPMASVTVLRVRNRLGTITNGLGKFTLYVQPGDTVLVRSVGFKPLFYLVHPNSKTDLTVDILLEEGALELPEVKVVGGLDYEKVNRALRNMKKPAEPRVAVRPPAPKPLFEDKAPAPPPAPTLENPASLLYDLLSKEGKDRRKLEARMAEEAARKKVLQDEKEKRAYDSLFINKKY
ncbi:MAG: carboxypeptidase-like regulatory domain-containing protein [Adhaeribacter sp.]